MDQDQVRMELKKAEGNGKAGHPYQLYKDSRGYYSIGWGFCIDPRVGASLPPPVAEFWLDYLIGRARDIAQNFTWYAKLNDARQNVIVCLIYNMGAASFLQFHDLMAALDQEDWNAAADALVNSRWFAELDPHPDDGTERGVRMVKALRTGVWD